MILTDRWFTIPEAAQNNNVQEQLKNDLANYNYKNYVIAAGRRSFKTERFCKRYAVKEAIKNSNWSVYLGAPTRLQAKNILWGDVKKLTPNYLIKKIYETELKIEFLNGSTLNVVGLKEFKRVQGGLAHLAIVTEYQDCEPDVYTESFQPMLNDTGGIWISEGRPFGKNHFYDDYLKGLHNEKGWSAYHWKSSEILSFEQIDRAKRELASKDYEREYDASFETEFGSPYYPYSKLNHVDYTPNKKLPIIITCDFNATEKPMSWVLGQKGIINGFDSEIWFKTLSHQFTNTETMCDITLEYLDKKFGSSKELDVVFYGDYAGHQHKSNSAYSDWEIIERKFTNKVYSFKKKVKFCDSIYDSIASTNARLCNTYGERRQFIVYDECKPLSLDWEKCEWKDNQRELKEKDAKRGHACRAVDYYNYVENRLKKKAETKIGVYA